MLPSTLFECSHLKASQHSLPVKMPWSTSKPHTFLAQLLSEGTRNSRGRAQKGFFLTGSVSVSEAAQPQLGSRWLHPTGSMATLCSSSQARGTHCLNAQREARHRDPWLPSDRLLEVVPGPPSQGLLRVDLHLSQAQDNGVNFCS